LPERIELTFVRLLDATEQVSQRVFYAAGEDAVMPLVQKRLSNSRVDQADGSHRFLALI
jgi:hypothetical protein